MARAVYVGGFGNGKKCAERVGEAMGKYYEDIDSFTFSDAMDNPDRLRRAVEKTDVYTHSAGMLAIQGMNPTKVAAFNAPHGGSTRLGLVTRTGLKTIRMHTPGVGIKTAEDISAIATYDASATAELAVHPIANLKHLGAIAAFDSLQAAKAAADQQIHVDLIHTTGDEYFRWSEGRKEQVAAAAVSALELEGVHDEIVLRPAAVLESYTSILGLNRY